MFHQKKEGFRSSDDIHQYYLDILNCIPNIIYWVDLDCSLMGCNSNFVNLLGVQRIKELTGTPYTQMESHLPWTADRIKLFMQDDMAVLYSGAAKYNIEELPVYNKEGDAVFYSSSRIPLLDSDKNIMGLVVVLADITAQVNMRKLSSQTGKASQRPPSVERLEKPVRVLLVEDNLIAQNAAKKMLEGLNCEVAIAGTGEAALLLFLPGKYDLVLMDITLPDTTGYIVSKRMRVMEKNTAHRVTIIGLTSYEAKVVKYDCTSYEMDGVLSKPLTSTQGTQVIKHFIYQEDMTVDGLESL